MVKNKTTARGFTLIELLVAASMAMFIGFGIYKVFSNGIAVWRWVDANKPSADTMIFFEKIANDLRNYCYFSEGSFQGSADELAFFIHDSDYLFLSKKELEIAVKETDKSIHKVAYVYVPSRKEIRRQTYIFGKDYPQTNSPVLSGISKIRYSYYFLDPSLDDFLETQEAVDSMPVAVGVWIEFQDSNAKVHQMQKTIALPLGMP